jgi:hypothetical protein
VARLGSFSPLAFPTTWFSPLANRGGWVLQDVIPLLPVSGRRPRNLGGGGGGWEDEILEDRLGYIPRVEPADFRDGSPPGFGPEVSLESFSRRAAFEADTLLGRERIQQTIDDLIAESIKKNLEQEQKKIQRIVRIVALTGAGYVVVRYVLM